MQGGMSLPFTLSCARLMEATPSFLPVTADAEDPMRVTDDTRPLGLIVSQHNVHPFLA